MAHSGARSIADGELRRSLVRMGTHGDYTRRGRPDCCYRDALAAPPYTRADHRMASEAEGSLEECWTQEQWTLIAVSRPKDTTAGRCRRGTSRSRWWSSFISCTPIPAM